MAPLINVLGSYGSFTRIPLSSAITGPTTLPGLAAKVEESVNLIILDCHIDETRKVAQVPNGIFCGACMVLDIFVSRPSLSREFLLYACSEIFPSWTGTLFSWSLE